MLRRNGGVFDVASIVELGSTLPCGTPPETEDHLFNSKRLIAVKDLDPAPFWKLLEAVSHKTLAGIFGKDLKAQRSGCAVDEGKGSASLGCVQPATPPKLFINGWGKIRMKVSDGAFDVDLSVTDLRVYEKDQKTPRSKVVADVQCRIEKGGSVILSVGLARAFQASGDMARRHWLQVNNIHLEDDHAWRAK